MRITVGGFLFVGGIGAVAVMGPLKMASPNIVSSQIESIQHSLDWVLSYFKGGPVETAPLTLDSKPIEPETVTSPSPEAAPPVEVSPVAAPVAVVETPPAPPQLTTPTPAAAPKKRSRRRRVKKTPAVQKTEPAASQAKPKAPPRKSKSAVKDQLIGTYVALKLKSGREVKGVLQGKSATQYTLEIPGMGPFQYPVDNVVGITPVE